MKNVDVAVYNYLKSVAGGSVQAGISTGTLQNGGIGLACVGYLVIRPEIPRFLG